MVNFIKTLSYTIKNMSNTNFNVKVVLEINGVDDQELLNKYYSYFFLDFKEDIILAKSERAFNLTFNPKDICEFKLQVKLMACSNTTIAKQSKTFEQVKSVALI
jgi:hypothetical protein